MRPVFPGATEKSQISHLPELLPLFERADCTAVKTAKAKEEDRTKIDPLEKSYVSTETGQVQGRLHHATSWLVTCPRPWHRFAPNTSNWRGGTFTRRTAALS